MGAYVTLIAGILLIPGIYYGVLILYRPSFKEEKNQKKIPLHSLPEIIVILLAEAAFIRIWWSLGKRTFSDLTLDLLFVMLVAMTIFCITDYWEKVVPNRILFLMVLLFGIILGFQGLWKLEVVMNKLPAIVIGFLFSALSFGLGYFISHRNIGAGDVKLSLVMGLYLTGEYVVGTILYGCIAGALFSIIQLSRRKLSRKDKIPFVPFLYIGLIIRYFIG